MTEDQQITALQDAVSEYRRVGYYYVCTDCGQGIEDDAWETLSAAAIDAHEQGWRCLNGLVFCPTCLKERQDKEQQEAQS